MPGDRDGARLRQSGATVGRDRDERRGLLDEDGVAIVTSKRTAHCCRRVAAIGTAQGRRVAEVGTSNRHGAQDERGRHGNAAHGCGRERARARDGRGTAQGRRVAEVGRGLLDEDGAAIGTSKRTAHGCRRVAEIGRGHTARQSGQATDNRRGLPLLLIAGEGLPGDRDGARLPGRDGAAIGTSNRHGARVKGCGNRDRQPTTGAACPCCPLRVKGCPEIVTAHGCGSRAQRSGEIVTSGAACSMRTAWQS